MDGLSRNPFEALQGDNLVRHPIPVLVGDTGDLHAVQIRQILLEQLPVLVKQFCHHDVLLGLDIDFLPGFLKHCYLAL